MNSSSTHSSEASRVSHENTTTSTATSTEARLWLTGFAVAALLLAVMVGALVWSASRAVAQNRQCARNDSANERPANLDDAFFQDPFAQTALLQSMQACSK
ncbi:hypothetical protein LJ656_13860 [Paraburkholderia sp. MMS20-SJTR3]|uniref:Uncharacterized protein n=1 Tax=Paraburkholderia sejongensis TaxID=2886946 RepID=A0ABS8JUU2_9BURK|nr:hypothetical protein [Paraburkholderia sp. MMS20-SJTR3]MCC8393676.1 hypothetical protein [Paraburkholderia sp. MMS20-SJTR3]